MSHARSKAEHYAGADSPFGTEQALADRNPRTHRPVDADQIVLVGFIQQVVDARLHSQWQRRTTCLPAAPGDETRRRTSG